MIEFANRLVVTLLVVVCAVTVVAAFLRRPARRDLRWLSVGLIIGVLGEAVIGAFVVYSKLNAYVVMTHFMVGMALLAVAVVLTLEASHGPGRGTLVGDPRGAMADPGSGRPDRDRAGRRDRHHRGRPPRRGEGGQAGPHRARGHDPDPRRDRADRRAVLLVLLWVLWRTNAPARVQDAGRVLLAVMVVQGVIGYTQFFTHLPALLVGIHVFGASMVWATALWFHHGLSDHQPEAVAGPDAVPTGPGGGAAAAGTGPSVGRPA